MDYRDKILSDIAKLECERISRKVRLALQKRTDSQMAGDYYCFMSRSESGLKNIWDEICVQVIDAEYSDYWEFFVFAVEDLIEPEVKKLPDCIQQAIWLKTDEGWKFEGGEFAFSTEELTRYIAKEYVFYEAKRWSNKRITQYMMDRHG